jgi:hypothetical protein
MTEERLIEILDDDEDFSDRRAIAKKAVEECLVTKRADLLVFLILDRLVPGTGDIVSGAEHDEIFLGVDIDDLAKVATEEDIILLRQLGVRESDGGLAMFA